MLRYISFICALGFVFGCCLTVIFFILLLPADNFFWPSVYENRLNYLKDAILTDSYIYRSGLYMYQNSLLNVSRQYDREEVYLSKKAAMLCYSVEQEADDETHASLIITTWAQHCDKTIMFYTSSDLLKKLHPRFIHSDKISLVYVNSHNSTIGTLMNTLKVYIPNYNWFVYVPAKVFLLPDNLKYYLAASDVQPDHVAFLGKPYVGKLFGSWEVSDSSPIAMSMQAIKAALNLASSSCNGDNIQGMLSCVYAVVM